MHGGVGKAGVGGRSSSARPCCADGARPSSARCRRAPAPASTCSKVGHHARPSIFRADNDFPQVGSRAWAARSSSATQWRRRRVHRGSADRHQRRHDRRSTSRRRRRPLRSRSTFPRRGFGPGRDLRGSTGASEIEFDIDLGGSRSPMNDSRHHSDDRLRPHRCESTTSDFGTAQPRRLPASNLNAPEARRTRRRRPRADATSSSSTRVTRARRDRRQHRSMLVAWTSEFSGPMTDRPDLPGTRPAPTSSAAGVSSQVTTSDGLGAGDDVARQRPRLRQRQRRGRHRTRSTSRAHGSGVDQPDLIAGTRRRAERAPTRIPNFENIVGGPFADNLTAGNSAKQRRRRRRGRHAEPERRRRHLLRARQRARHGRLRSRGQRHREWRTPRASTP